MSFSCRAVVAFWRPVGVLETFENLRIVLMDIVHSSSSNIPGVRAADNMCKVIDVLFMLSVTLTFPDQKRDISMRPTSDRVISCPNHSCHH